MSFRAYISEDPVTKKDISKSELMRFYDSLVEFELQGKAKICPVENARVILDEMLKTKQTLQALAKAPILSPAVSSPKDPKANKYSSRKW